MVNSMRGKPGFPFITLNNQPTITAGLRAMRRLPVNPRRRAIVPILHGLVTDIAVGVAEQAFYIETLAKDFQARADESAERKKTFGQRARRLVRLLKDCVTLLSDNVSAYGPGYQNSAAVATSITSLPPIWVKLDRLYNKVQKLCKDFGTAPVTSDRSNTPTGSH